VTTLEVRAAASSFRFGVAGKAAVLINGDQGAGRPMSGLRKITCVLLKDRL
jgi:hypothetical protein